MPADPKTPFSVVFSNAMIRVFALLVPGVQRTDWRQEWLAEIWHRWQFLFHLGEWNRREDFRLLRDCLGALPDAVWHMASQETIRTRLHECARSPWTCLGGLTSILLVIGLMSSGFAATRQVLWADSQAKSARLLFIWFHPVIGGPDRGLPPDAVSAWALHSHLLEGVAPFNIGKLQLTSPRPHAIAPLVIRTEPSLFDVLRLTPAAGKFPSESGVVLDHRTWTSVFHADPKIIGSHVKIGSQWYSVAAILPAGLQFLTRQPSLYLVQHRMTDARVMVVARAKPGVTKEIIDRELTKIAEDFAYYFFSSQLRFSFLENTLLTPVVFFCVAALASMLILLSMCQVRLRQIRSAWLPENRRAALRRGSFFGAKVTLALLAVFTAGLEWSRSQSAVLYASKDPANGPLLVWLYILGAMGVLFWAVADQRARCRVCLRLLCFPVRVGCPGCLLLSWSGTELLCSEGHGILHVPHLAPSWDEESEHWISLDESWRDLFAQTK